jgi:hypothetical protein
MLLIVGTRAKSDNQPDIVLPDNTSVAASATDGQAWLDCGPTATGPRDVQKVWRSTTIKTSPPFGPLKWVILQFLATADSLAVARDKANNIPRVHGGVRFCLALSGS